MRRTIVAGNWKMNKTNSESVAMLTELKELVKGMSNVGIVLGVPFTALSDAVKAVEGSNIEIAAQNMNPNESGAFTGEIAPSMLTSIGVKYVILGHSERREYYKECDEFINEKVKAALKNGLTPILCIGEKLEDRESGRTDEVNKKQLQGGMAGLTAEEAAKVVIAYEPVWAIGTGKTATPEVAQETHKAIRNFLADMFGAEVAEEITIQYGGSMKADNAAELMGQTDIDGGLVGGASLEASSFSKIVEAGVK
ncbi:triose-phosphate isomerase [uncultured Ilyobacter sp.]|uniref:triose-phosphate isomerase n=1 Tax=uncultured Ilyobacter sp. TaxID=544433 RepID=UPI0029F4AB44|nr:triose-phosphate isomerase [uncultured Ilyobacter sp.]